MPAVARRIVARPAGAARIGLQLGGGAFARQAQALVIHAEVEPSLAQAVPQADLARGVLLLQSVVVAVVVRRIIVGVQRERHDVARTGTVDAGLAGVEGSEAGAGIGVVTAGGDARRRLGDDVDGAAGGAAA